jgi:predicted patatin/cPLA2 family phospholipase
MRADRFTKTALAVLALAALGACGIEPVQFVGTPGQPRQCAQIMTRVMIDPDPQKSLTPAFIGGPGPSSPGQGAAADDPLGEEILGFYPAPEEKNDQIGPLTTSGKPLSDSWLLLSGGSQHGAFGAGFLNRWAEARKGAGGLPRFRVVTGISTGALQSTFVFIDQPQRIAEEYTIPNEKRLLHTFVRPNKKGELNNFSVGYNLAKKGSLADLDPLRKRLHTIITDDVLAKVAEQAGTGPDNGRKLLVGAVEMDTGNAYLFDLTKAASLYVAGNAAMKNCYIEALMASASVPMAALPVFIEGRMYIDGGARFGVIADWGSKLLEQAAQKAGASKAPRHLFVLVNGTLEASRTCELADCRGKTPPPPPTEEGPTVRPHGEWSFDKLAKRSVSILINQSYRGSVFWARTEGAAKGFAVKFARIEPDHLNFKAEAGLEGEAKETMSCAEWSKRDDAIDRPLEFHPRFMRCLIAYGRARTDAAAWAAAE